MSSRAICLMGLIKHEALTFFNIASFIFRFMLPLPQIRLISSDQLTMKCPA